MSSNQFHFQLAVRDFQAARQRAAIEEVMARVTGRSNALLSYEEIAQKLGLNIRTERGVQSIPLAAVVGSVGRTTDFTRTFLPRRNADQERWARVKAAFDTSEAGLPPIEVYKVGAVYFVLDGNHRVSIARQEGLSTLEAHVIEVRTSVPLTADMSPAELDAALIKAEHAEFLTDTRLTELRPNVDLTVTVPGQYKKLREQIRIQEFLLKQARSADVSPVEVVTHWYDEMYIPLAETIRERGLLHWFPERTPTDLVAWIYKHRADLEKELGWDLSPEAAAISMTVAKSTRAGTQESESGSWRAHRLVDRYSEKLFKDILVPLSGDPESWSSLEQAILIAQREGASLHGLHVVDAKEKVNSPLALKVQAQFSQRCEAAGVPGKLAIEVGEISPKICQRAILTDLVVLKIVHPPQRGLSSLLSPFRAVLAGSPRPVLGVSGSATRLERGLIAYDGSPKSKEALFVATYLAEQWRMSLSVFTALEGWAVAATVQDYARAYLEFHEIEAEYILESGSAQALKEVVTARDLDLLLMGSYSSSPLKEVFIGSQLDVMLREARIPIFICR